MLITITDVKVEKVKTYQQALIAYTGFNGEAKSWKLFSFANPATFAILKDAQAGEQYEITTGKTDGKDGKEYTSWTSATKVGTSQAPVPGAVKAAWVPDADRQRLIVKQSCLAQAIAYRKAADDPGDVADILATADEFVAYVYDVPTLEVEAF